MRSLQAAAAAAALFSISAPAWAAGQSMIGLWAPDPASCTPVDGMVDIGALTLTADETSCMFDDVSRAAKVVTWHGRCSDGATSTPTTVVAALRSGRLTFTMNGTPNGPYRRCRDE